MNVIEHASKGAEGTNENRTNVAAFVIGSRFVILFHGQLLLMLPKLQLLEMDAYIVNAFFYLKKTLLFLGKATLQQGTMFSIVVK
jgi:hypothetical protein